jgi:Flp pilus assembly protein TadG
MDRLYTVLKKLKHDQNGSVLVLAVAAMLAILGVTAFVVDVGNMVLEKRRLQSACDAAALAASRELPSYAVTEERAFEYLALNNVPSENATVIINSDKTKVTVEASKKVEHFFAQVLGKNSTTVSARAAAVYGSIKGMKGVVPFGIPDQILRYGEEYTLKAGSHDEYGPGNYGPLALEFRGASNYTNNLKNGYSGMVKVGDWILTEPGNMSGPTEEGVTYRLNKCPHTPECTIDHYHPDCPRVMIVPIFDPTSLQGRSEVHIVGFGVFLLKGVAGSGNKSTVTGYFLEMVPPDGLDFELDPNQTDYGLHASRLVE